MWLVVNVTNYGTGVYFGGIYRSREKAEQRLAWIEENMEQSENEDSWRLAYVPNMKINDPRIV